MFWADKLLQKRKGREWVNDAWTPSGIVHMGGLKGPVIHDVLYKILKEQKKDVTYSFGFDDFDPIDGLPANLLETHEKYMGVPTFMAPSPDGNGTFAEFFGSKMRDMFAKLGIEAKIYLASENYKNGVYNEGIRIMLDSVVKVRKVYEEMYKNPVKDNWYPLQVICPNCQKLGTTKVTDWDGKDVTFTCLPDLVTWAKGCGTTGKISPFDGNAKMPWKPEWSVKWYTFKVTIEGAGKDHMSAGGSFEIAAKILKVVFGQNPPMELPYEFFLWNGKKMSSSKGLGLTDEELLKILPPQVVRFLMIKTEPNKAVEFNPKETEIIPKLYDDYQKAAEAYFHKTDEDLARAFELSQIGKVKKPPTVRFSILAQWVQMPNMQNKIKEEGLEDWAKYAKVWVEQYAPASARFLVQKEVPVAAKSLTDQQKELLQKIASELEKDWDAEEFQTQIYEYGKALGLNGKETFAAIYKSLIGKDHGPKAAWLILSLDKKFVTKRFEEAIAMNQESGSKNQGPSTRTRFDKPEIFSLNSFVKEHYPSISIGIATITGVSIEKTHPALEKEKQQLLENLQGLTTEQLGQYTEIISYRKLYKAMGVDWHSRRPSPEALLRRVALNKGLYTINTCVDAYNLVVMQHRVSVGAFDLDTIAFPTELRFAKEDEEILLLGDSDPTKYKPTELAYFDQKGGYNIDFNFRDAQRTAVQLETKNILLNVDGIYDITPQEVEKVLQESVDKIIKYCGGTVETFGIEAA
ncbi:MAG: lysine--tRNA ligase [Candidatus Levyibacteriota bacterium]